MSFVIFLLVTFYKGDRLPKIYSPSPLSMGMKRKTEIQTASVGHDNPKILHITTTVSKEENISAH
jgi:hypothetical protein